MRSTGNIARDVSAVKRLCHCADCKMLHPRFEMRSASASSNNRIVCKPCYSRIANARQIAARACA